MKHRILQGTAVLAVVGGVLTGPIPVMAAPPPAASKIAAKNVALTSGGTLTGQVVDANGFGLDGAMVIVHLAQKVVAKTVTDESGTFTVTNLRGGTYQITSGQTTGLFRLWAENTAPPQSYAQVLLVSEPEVVRGQTGGPLFFNRVNTTTVMQLSTVGLAGIGAGFGVASYVESEDANDTAEKTLRTVQQQQSSPK